MDEHSRRRRLSRATVAAVAGVVALLVVGLPRAVAQTATRPNVLVIVADDLRVDAVGALGDTPVITPNLDRLVAAGTAFERTYCFGSQSGAVCAPSRAMMLTGRTEFELRKGFTQPWGRNADADGNAPVTLPEAFRAAGYHTFGTGKWHQPRSAFARGFTHGGSIFFGGMGSHTTLAVFDFDPAGAYDNGARRPLREFSSAEFASRFIEFVGARAGDAPPFFAWVSFTAPHDPRTPPESFRALYDPASLPLPPNFMPEHPFDNGEMRIRDERLAPWPRTPEIVREHLADYYGMVTHMDAQVGRMLSALDAAGERDGTIVVFLSDHGLAIGSHGLLGKQNLYEHSMRSPLVVTGPGLPRGRRVRALTYLHDVMPTLLELARLPVPEDVSARSFAWCLDHAPGEGIGRAHPNARDALLLEYRGLHRAIVEQRWKLIDYPEAGVTQLYDVGRDPHEIDDLATRHPDEVRRLRRRLLQLMADASDPLILER